MAFFAPPIMIAAAAAFAGLGAAPTAPTPVAPAGHVEQQMLASSLYGRDRRLWVYTPSGYSPNGDRVYDLLVVFDGRMYLEDIALPAILEKLAAEGKAGPFVAVLLDNATSTERLEDLGNHERFAAFLAEEVLEWVRRRWKVTRDPHRTIVAGASAGGLAAAYVAFQRPDLFGNVLSQSGAFRRGNEGSNDAPFEWLTSRYAASPRRDVRFWVEVGSRESRGALGGAAPSILESNRRFRDALRAKGYAVTYAEVPEGEHDVSLWQNRLPAGISALATRAGSP